ncbi:hypothetical protein CAUPRSCDRAFT_11939 [Caulochytrium protostelioides]|uniref:Reverse transcriptase domain-containing protein n=1 Tax=Caulochytrium protostelioides TaxID=1555241 RepID=A0A4P9WY11_9FUNG|nr:hypothetical protein CAUPRSCDRAFT_11939 [Caulochytrium protostelioides]
MTERLRLLMFADDVVLLAESRPELPRACDHFTRWVEALEMAVGIAKCGVMTIGAPSSLTDFPPVVTRSGRPGSHGLQVSASRPRTRCPPRPWLPTGPPRARLPTTPYARHFSPARSRPPYASNWPAAGTPSDVQHRHMDSRSPEKLFGLTECHDQRAVGRGKAVEEDHHHNVFIHLRSDRGDVAELFADVGQGVDMLLHRPGLHELSGQQAPMKQQTVEHRRLLKEREKLGPNASWIIRVVGANMDEQGVIDGQHNRHEGLFCLLGAALSCGKLVIRRVLGQEGRLSLPADNGPKAK